MAARLDQLPGFEIAFSQPIMDSVLDYVFDPHSALAIKVFGDDFNELRRIGNDIIGVLNTVPGVTDAAIDQYTPLPQISIKVDRAATARYGINVADVANLISTGIGGAAVSQVFIGDRHYDITVRFPAAARNSPEAIKNLRADLERRRAHPAVAGRPDQAADRREHDQSRDEPSLSPGEAQLSRSRSAVGGGGRHRKRSRKKSRSTGSKYHIEWGGQLEGQQRAEARFRLIIGLVLGGDDGAALCRVRRVAPGLSDRRRRAAGDARRA